MKIRKSLTITEDEKIRLIEEYKHPSTEYSKMKSCIILLLSKGYSTEAISRHTGVSTPTIRTWCEKYKNEGFDFILKERGRPVLNRRIKFENEEISKASSGPFKCTCCGKEYPEHSKKYFIQHIVAGKYLISSVCKECKKNHKYDKEYSPDKTKLLCHKCMEYKPIDDFHIDSSPSKGHHRIVYRNGRKSFCKECAKKVERERYMLRSDDGRLYKCIQFRWLGARDRAKKKNIEFNITKEDLINKFKSQNGKCALSGIPMTFEMYNNRTNTNLSIDRIDPKKGYIIDNIQLVCMMVNQMKNDLSTEELVSLCRKIIEKYDNNEKYK